MGSALVRSAAVAEAVRYCPPIWKSTKMTSRMMNTNQPGLGVTNKRA